MKKENKAPEKGKLLLRTYLTSLLSLMLCVTMLLGTTYAWFTSEVTTAGNEIYVGTLKVDMTDADGKSLVGAAALFGNTAEKVFRWEPGATQVETVKIVNKGDLAFHYGVYLSTIAMTAAQEDFDPLAAIGQYIEVYTPVGDTYTTDKFVKDEWKLRGTLKDVVTDGTMLAGGKYTDVVETKDKATDATKQEVATVTIALHMKEETTDPTIMGKSINNLGIKLIATQTNAEGDYFGDQYDKDAAMPVSTSEALLSALDTGASVKLLDNIELEEELAIDGDKDLTIDLNGKSLTVAGKRAIKADGSATLTLQNGTVNAADGDVLGIFGDASIEAEKVIFNGKYCFGMNGTTTSDKSSAAFTDCEFHITSGYNAAYISAKGTYTFKNCVLEGGSGILIRSGNVTLDGCTIIANGYQKPQPAFFQNTVIDSESTDVMSGVKYWTSTVKNEGSVGDCVAIIDRSGDGYELKSVTIKNCTFKFADTVVGKSYAVRYFDKATGTATPITPVLENNFVEDANGVKTPLVTTTDPAKAGTYSIYKQ